MKTHIGSLQKKGRRYYLVVYKDGKQRWFALNTEKLYEARIRAARIAPTDSTDETSWLRQLVRVGHEAERQLVMLRMQSKLTWANIAATCTLAGVTEGSDESRRTHARWLAILHQVANSLSPGELTKEQSVAIMQTLAVRYVSAPRMLRFFRHAWRALGLDESIWPNQMPAHERVDRCEYYRRLTIEEVRKIHRHLLRVSPPLADMVMIGYSTGLRLSDVAQLEMSEMDGAFLRVCPNKTRRCKPMPLKIPLTSEARAVILRLSVVAAAQQRRFLFDDRVQKDVSRHLSRAFRACGVGREGKGRASFHSLRATFISLMDEAGVPPHITDSITGHGGGGMHARYTQPSDAALAEAVTRAISPLVEIS